MRPLHHRPILYTPFAVLLAAACTTSAVENTAGSSQLTTSPSHGVTVLPPPPETVEEVVDGRTVGLSNGLKARVIGLAAPGECWQAGALKFAQDTLLGKPVRYSRASEAAITLRLANTPDQTDYATLAVSKGVVRAEKDDPVLTDPEKVAQQAGLGLWGPPCQGQDTSPAPAPPPPPPAPPAPTTTPPPAQKDCSVSYRVAKTWADGFHAELIVRNNTRKPFEQWNLQWRFPSGQRIRETWGMTAYQYGADVTAISQDGGAIPAGGQVSLRFNAGTSGPNVQPKTFTLSGKECSVG